MTAFISYARRDESAVSALHADMERSGRSAWFDGQLEGGQLWWDVILEHIRACELFVFALSPESLASKACQAELEYAIALHLPLLPVMVRTVNLQLAPDLIGARQIVDYRQRTPESAMALVLALTHATPAGPLPDPLPSPPVVPMSSLGPCRERIAAPELTYEEQLGLLSELRRRADNNDERDAVRSLLHQWRARPDIVEAVARDVDALIARLPRPDDDQPWFTPDASPSIGVDAARGDSADLLRSLLTHIKTRHITPILGLGMSDSLIGTRRDLAREWARSFDFPLARPDQDDLAHVAQFVAVMSDQDTLRESLAQQLRDQIDRRHPGLAAEHPEANLRDLFRLAWEKQRATLAADPHMVVASLPCAIYITAHPANLLADALRAVGKEPRVEICRWRPDVYDWPASPFASEPDYVPDVHRPLVFHAFGNVDAPESLVLTEDDFLAHLVSVTEDKTLIPLPVRSALADSSLLLLGFGLVEWEIRILLLSLISQEGAYKLQRYTHVAAQIAPGQNVASPARARRYLERYFSKVLRPAIDIYWGSVDEFTTDLAEMWGESR